MDDEGPASTTLPRRLLVWEIAIVLALSLGHAAVYAIANLLDRVTSTIPLGEQSTQLHQSISPRPWWDLLYQLLAISFAVVPVVLAVYLLRPRLADLPGKGGAMRASARRIGLDFSKPRRDSGWGIALAAAVGIPGIAFYLLGRAAGITVSVETSALRQLWWTIPVLVLSAIQNGLLEEVVVVAYLVRRLDDLAVKPWAIYASSALLRGTYHLYQGFGPFFGNAAMGVLFVWWYRRDGRVAPLVVAHTLLDVVSFVGPILVPATWLAAGAS